MNKRIFLISAAVLMVAAFGLGMAGQQIIPIPELFQPKVSGAAAVAGAANVPDSPYFKNVDVYNLKSTESRTILEHYKTYQQTTAYTCGPAAALTVVAHFRGEPFEDELAMARLMHTNPAESREPGTSTANMAQYFKDKGWVVHSSGTDKTPADYQEFLAFVLKNLKRGVPIMVENVDWGGHWRVIIGYDTMGDNDKGEYNSGNDVLFLADPFDTSDHNQDGYNIISAERFYYMWFDAHLFKKSQQQKQWVTAEPPAKTN